MELHEKKEIISPPDGWEPNTYYLVDASLSPSNPVHRAIFAVGFLGVNAPSKSEPGNYSKVWNNTYERPYRYSEIHYMSVVRKLVGEAEMKSLK